ncbi:MAG: zinc ABC transporter substrate-binding protein [Clostridia bacterium]|nr:zinc ABC transporter substrate-binding protein [Clostridia bacterium]
MQTRQKTAIRTIAALLCAVLLCAPVLGCGAPKAQSDETLRVVATIFPLYDWAKNVLGDNPGGASLSLLVQNGVDLHSYAATVDDMIMISSCDLFVYVGGESDDWVKNVLQQAKNPDMVALNLLDVLGDAAKAEELIEGMEGEAEEGALDEHIWLSLKNASVCTDAIADALASLDPTNAESYAANAASYRAKLSALDDAYAAAVSAAPQKKLLFGDRFPFRYLADDYGLSYYAAFAGCSAETEASFETILFLAGKVDALSLHTVLVIDGSDRKIAETVVRSTATQDQAIRSLDSMQSVTQQEANAGETYLAVMERNLIVLRDALQ